LVAKYGRLDGVAYALIQDREGTVLANSLGSVVPALEANASGDRREVGPRRVNFQGKVVYESRGSVLEGRLGTVYLGMWADTIQNEIYQGFLLLLAGIALVVIAAALGAVVLTGRLIRPFRRLTEIAGRMSTGDLDTPVPVESQKDFGELTRSLERMRASLKAAMMRLNQN
jgi:HAMP domain-containing protein